MLVIKVINIPCYSCLGNWHLPPNHSSTRENARFSYDLDLLALVEGSVRFGYLNEAEPISLFERISEPVTLKVHVRKLPPGESETKEPLLSVVWKTYLYSSPSPPFLVSLSPSVPLYPS